MNILWTILTIITLACAITCLTLSIIDTIRTSKKISKQKLEEHYTDEVINVPVKGGYLFASQVEDIDYPGIHIEYISHEDNGKDLSRPRVIIEYPKDGKLRALIWNDPNSEDYTEEVYLL